MSSRILPNSYIEDSAARLLDRYGTAFGQLAVPPVPVEDIVDGLLDLRILWDTIAEPSGESILAGLDPKSRTIVFNDTRRHALEDTPGLYNTVLAHEVGHWELHVEHGLATQQSFPSLESDYDCLYHESPILHPSRESQAHKFMAFLLMPSHLLREAIYGVDLTNWKSLYQVKESFQVTISALKIRLEQLGLIYVSSDGQVYNSIQEYHGQRRMAL